MVDHNCRARPKGWLTPFKMAVFAGLFLLAFRPAREATVEASPVPPQFAVREKIPYERLTNVLGSWIWSSTAADNQTVRMWRSFDIPASAPIKEAQLYITADDEFDVYIDGHEVGQGADWGEVFLLNLTDLLSPGRHVIAVKAFNSFSFAGMILGLRIDLKDGRRLEVKSDGNWKIAPDDAKHWQKMTEAPADWPAATVEAPWGAAPWKLERVHINVMPTPITVKVQFWQTGQFQLLLLIVCGGVIIISLWLLAQLAAHRKENWLLIRERTRIARDIHDDLGSKLTQLVLNCEAAPRDLSPGRIGQNVREMLSSLDEILWAVNPRQDTLREFASYVCSYAEQFLKFTSIHYFLDVPQDIPATKANLPLRRGLLMAIKESLNNAVKHSGAGELRLQIRTRPERLIVILTDNGKGFDPGAVNGNGNGLANMNQRMTELGGTCTVVSQPGKGCQVEFSVPMKPRRWQM
ncbi:MAG: ATP-binding protein [Limisphaerales bacterium]